MLDQRRRRWADVVYMLYKCLVFAGQEDFLSNIVHLFNVGSMLGYGENLYYMTIYENITATPLDLHQLNREVSGCTGFSF